MKIAIVDILTVFCFLFGACLAMGAFFAFIATGSGYTFVTFSLLGMSLIGTGMTLERISQRMRWRK